MRRSQQWTSAARPLRAFRRNLTILGLALIALALCLGTVFSSVPSLAQTSEQELLQQLPDLGNGSGNGSGHEGSASDPLQDAALGQSFPEDEDPERSRERVLAELYGQLAQTKDAETATAVASAIEQVWLHSGSDTVDLLMERAMSALGQEQGDLALELLDAVVKIAPDYAEGWNRRAYVHFTRQNYTHALVDLQKVLALDPKHFKAINGLAQIEREFGDSNSALKAFRLLLKVHPFLDGALSAEKELAREVEGQEI